MIIVAGTFDLFHIGHVNLLKRASNFGDVLAFVNTDRFVEEFKHRKPVVNQEDRRAVVKTCKYVTDVQFNDNADLKETLKYIDNITGIVFGDDYDIEKYRKQTQITREWQALKGIALIQLPRTDGVSSTDIRSNLHT